MYKCILFAWIGLSSVAAFGQSSRTPSKSFLEFLDKADVAQMQLQQGKPADYKELWSHSEEVTLSGGFGGKIEKGWTNVSKRLDWAGSQFTNGTNKIERVVTAESGDLGYLVQYEHIRYNPPGQTTEALKDYRVTMIFRRERGAWRIVHRHADSQTIRPS
jgi:hypothetical protein